MALQHPSTCTPAARPDTRDLMAHTPHPPSRFPGPTQSSPDRAPDTDLLALPIALPVSLGSVPVDLLESSDPHSSTVAPHGPPPPLPGCALPDLQTTFARICPAHRAIRSGSIPPAIGVSPGS